MIFDIARRIVGTSGRLAWVHALVVAAGQPVRAAAVAQADRQRWTAVLHADARRPVVHHDARLIVRTGGRPLTGGKARIQTAPIETGHVRGAPVVAEALALLRCAHQLPNVIDNEAVGADAARTVPPRYALLVRVTDKRCRYRARIAALAARVAAQTLVTVAVGRASNRHYLGIVRSRTGRYFCALGIRFALDVRASDVAVRARASRPVLYRLAEGIVPACTSQRARIGALASDARLINGALQIVRAGFV